MKVIETRKAVGCILCHDITQIVKDRVKGVAFKKGHIVKEEDIEKLLSLGKDHLYVWENKEGILHENDAAQVLKNACKNKYMKESEVKEGKIELFSTVDGVLKVDIDRLNKVNSLGEIMIATRHNNFPIKKDDKLVGTRIIPLVIEKTKMDKVEELCKDKPILTIKPFKHKKVAIVTTGNEVFYGRIKDTFGPVIIDKLKEYNVEVIGQKIVNDDPQNITNAIKNFIEKGAEVVLCTGGMSVDPDDKTPKAIKDTGAEIISYGAPVLPGAMLMVSYYKENNKCIPIIGVPGCAMYAKRTVLDLILPRIMVDDIITNQDLIKLGSGGLCLNCDVCHYPNCSFGKTL